jgi:hypothetical protein
VVLAGSTGAGEVDAPIAATVQPVSTYVAVTAPLGERLFEAVRYTGAISDTRRAGDYYRIVSDDRLMWGGRISMRGSTPWRLKAALRSDILKVYPQLEGVEIDYTWSGVMAYAVHKMPQIGELAQGYWLASAFGGHGLNTTAMAGEMIARAILEGDDRWRLFSPYELVWAGGRSGRVAAQTLLWSLQTRDSLKERLARYRDRARREADARQIRFEAERAMRKAEAERLRTEEEARRIAEQEARRLAAEEAAAPTRQVEGHKAETAAPESAVEPVVAPEAAAAPEVVATPDVSPAPEAASPPSEGAALEKKRRRKRGSKKAEAVVPSAAGPAPDAGG